MSEQPSERTRLEEEEEDELPSERTRLEEEEEELILL